MSLFTVIASKFDDTGIRKAQREFSGLGKSVARTLGAIGLGASLAGTVALVKESVTAAATDLKSQRLLAGQLKRTVGATKEAISANEDWLSSLSMAVGIVDDDLRPSLANAVRGTGSLAKGQKLLQIALDGAAATGKPLNTVMQALIKASNGQTTSLYKLAPELKKTKGTLDDFALSVKGAARESADPFARFKVATDELKEKFGKLLLPEMTKFVDYLTKTVVPAVSKFLDDVGNPKTDAGKVFKDIKDAVGQAFKDVKDFFAMFGNGDAMKGFGVVASSLVKALPALIALKGIMVLASAGTAITNLVKAVGLVRGTETVPTGTGVPGTPIIGGAKPATPTGGMSWESIGKLTGFQAFALGGMVAGGGGVRKRALTQEEIDYFRAKNPQIIVNNYGSTPAEFDNMIKRALDKHNKVNGKP